MQVTQTPTVLDAPREFRRDRRQLIIDSALDVIAEHGVEGMTHRRVATAAGVTLSATTYYFDTIEGLLVAAMTEAARENLHALTADVQALPPDADMVKFVAGAIIRRMTENRRNTIVIGELYTAALRRKELQEVAIAWETSWFNLIAPRVGARAASAIGAMSGGMVQSALMRHSELDAEDIEDMTRRLFKACQAE